MIETSPQLKKISVLTPASFEQLLACLGPDREAAANAYLDLRQALFTYFTLRGATAPEELTDETLDRVARRLSEGQIIFTANLKNYFYGVARNVWRETLVKANTVTQLPETPLPLISGLTPHDVMVETLETAESEKRLGCLQKCLAQFSDEERELVLSYYRDSGGAKIEKRKALAQTLGLSPDSLRHKLARLRLKLGSCVRQCLKT